MLVSMKPHLNFLGLVKERGTRERDGEHYSSRRAKEKEREGKREKVEEDKRRDRGESRRAA